MPQNDRRAFLSAVAAALLARPLAAQVTATVRRVRIGILSLRAPVSNPRNDALFEGLRERGYIAGENVVLDYPDTEGREERLPAIAADLVKRRPDVILVVGPAPLPAARNATTSIPLVMVASSGDPVAEGVAQSLSRPGGNVTGLTYAEPDRFKKQLELLKATAPRTARVAVLWDFDLASYRQLWHQPLADAGRILGLRIEEPVRVGSADDLPAAFDTLRQRADALLVASGGTNFAARERIGRLAIEHRLPGIAAFKEFPRAGLLMSYGPDIFAINRRAGDFVDRILKGARAGDLPIELPSSFEFVVNRATAAALGLSIPAAVLARTTEVV
jgi:putative ABC transport system substrate-binding protein